MSNKNGPDTGDVRTLLARADLLLERAYYASDDTEVSLGIARTRRALAEASAGRTD